MQRNSKKECAFGRGVQTHEALLHGWRVFEDKASIDKKGRALLQGQHVAVGRVRRAPPQHPIHELRGVPAAASRFAGEEVINDATRVANSVLRVGYVLDDATKNTHHLAITRTFNGQMVDRGISYEVFFNLFCYVRFPAGAAHGRDSMLRCEIQGSAQNAREAGRLGIH